MLSVPTFLVLLRGSYLHPYRWRHCSGSCCRLLLPRPPFFFQQMFNFLRDHARVASHVVFFPRSSSSSDDAVGAAFCSSRFPLACLRSAISCAIMSSCFVMFPICCPIVSGSWDISWARAFSFSSRCGYVQIGFSWSPIFAFLFFFCV